MAELIEHQLEGDHFIIKRKNRIYQLPRSEVLQALGNRIETNKTGFLSVEASDVRMLFRSYDPLPKLEGLAMYLHAKNLI